MQATELQQQRQRQQQQLSELPQLLRRNSHAGN
jgi:hypothetical protein